MMATRDAIHPHDLDPMDALVRRIGSAIERHGPHRVSIALRLSRPTILALAARAPVLGMTIYFAGQHLYRLDELDQIADAEAAAEAERQAAERARADAERDIVADVKSGGRRP